jgi:hypothetical protein
MGDKSMRCPIDESLMIDYLEGSLNDPLRAEVRSHILNCQSCADTLYQLSRVEGFLAAPGLREVEMPSEEFWRESTRLIDEATWRKPRTWRKSFEHAAWKVLAAAACLLLVFIGVDRAGFLRNSGSSQDPSLAARQGIVMPVEQDSLKVMRRLLTDYTLAAEYLQTVSDESADSAYSGTEKPVMFPAGAGATVYDGLMDLDEEQLDGVMAIMAGY